MSPQNGDLTDASAPRSLLAGAPMSNGSGLATLCAPLERISRDPSTVTTNYRRFAGAILRRLRRFRAVAAVVFSRAVSTSDVSAFPFGRWAFDRARCDVSRSWTCPRRRVGVRQGSRGWAPENAEYFTRAVRQQVPERRTIFASYTVSLADRLRGVHRGPSVLPYQTISSTSFPREGSRMAGCRWRDVGRRDGAEDQDHF
jgi:hypothetical protein